MVVLGADIAVVAGATVESELAAAVVVAGEDRPDSLVLEQAANITNTESNANLRYTNQVIATLCCIKHHKPKTSTSQTRKTKP